MSSMEALKKFEDGSLDIVFIDGNHRYKHVYDDIKGWLPKIRKGGYLCGHNFSEKNIGVVKAVNELLDSNKVYIKHDSVWTYKK
jgi:predicted O-methyltransferase YrrM